MTIPISTYLTELGMMLGDDTETVWTPGQKFAFLKRAYRLTMPDFFTPVIDTTYTLTGAVPAQTEGVTVPAVFLPGSSTTEINLPGEITGIRIRMTNTTTIVEPMIQNWFWLSRAYIDPLNIKTVAPKIHFLTPFDNNIFEMELHGNKPLVIPAANDATALDGSDNPGFMEWLTCQVMVFCMQARETKQDEDKRGYGRRRLLDQSDADKMRARYRMGSDHRTSFEDIAR